MRTSCSRREIGEPTTEQEISDEMHVTSRKQYQTRRSTGLQMDGSSRAPTYSEVESSLAYPDSPRTSFARACVVPDWQVGEGPELTS